MFELIFGFVITLYFIQTIIFLIGANKKYSKLDDDKLKTVTVIVAARNEETNILDCLNSLDNLKYPDNKIEIVIVDDHSTDNTYRLVEEFIKDKQKFKLIQPAGTIGKLKGKANAIANAVSMTQGEIILTTDADCIVSSTWAKTISSYYVDNVAMVCGYTDQNEDKYFHAMQSVDFIYLLAVAGGMMNIGKPLSCIGNNMSYRRSVYEEVGGYEAIPFSVTEDFKLLMTMHKLKKYKIIYPLDKDALVTSKACNDITSLYSQKKRWGVGGLDSDVIGFSVMATGFLSHIGIITAPFFLTENVVYMLLFKLFTDYFFLKSIYSKLKLNLKLMHFIVFEIYFILYVIALPIILLLNRNVQWKGRIYRRSDDE
ncbi:MAG: glycosyltransferase [Melioribacteraceae bacterium]|nr:glycosyltransferase [Melioribacteraceae bacterium]